MKLMLKLTLFYLFMVTSFSAQANESWLYVQGANLSFVLPRRPLVDLKYYETMKDLRPLIKGDVGGKIPEIAKNTCPKMTKVLMKIYSRIVEKNSLNEFIQSGPGMNLLVECKNPKNGNLGVHTTRYNMIFIPAKYIKAAASEDQLAHVLGHEISHALFGHGEKLWEVLDETTPTSSQQIDLSDRRPRNFDFDVAREQERIADVYGAILSWNAGYYPFLQKTWWAAHKADGVGSMSSGILHELGLSSDFHDKIKDRERNVKEALAGASIPEQSLIVSQELIEAKAEYERLNGK